MIKIQKNVPIPKRESKYPFEKMIVGDSFWVEMKIQNLRQYSSKAGRLLKRKFICKEENKGTRCWRIK